MDGNTIKEIQFKHAALDAAIKSGVGTFYNEEGLAEINPDRIVEAANKFHSFMRKVD